VKCPHCLTAYHDQPVNSPVQYRGGDTLNEKDGTSWTFQATLCPECGKATIVLVSRRHIVDGGGIRTVDQRVFQVWPKGIARTPLPTEVPENLAADYREACLVLADSPKASAALSRRCLQNLLREQARVTARNLNKAIQQVLDSKTLPSHHAEAIDAVRTVGNFAAHPIKSTNTGAIINVEPGEAEWLLDTLDGLFDFYFAQPAILQRKREALNAKLAEAQKPPLK